MTATLLLFTTICAIVSSVRGSETLPSLLTRSLDEAEYKFALNFHGSSPHINRTLLTFFNPTDIEKATADGPYIAGAARDESRTVAIIHDPQRQQHWLVWKANTAQCGPTCSLHVWPTTLPTKEHDTCTYVGVISRSLYGYVCRITKGTYSTETRTEPYPYQAILRIIPLSSIDQLILNSMDREAWLTKVESASVAQHYTCFDPAGQDVALVRPHICTISPNGQHVLLTYQMSNLRNERESGRDWHYPLEFRSGPSYSRFLPPNWEDQLVTISDTGAAGGIEITKSVSKLVVFTPNRVDRYAVDTSYAKCIQPHSVRRQPLTHYNNQWGIIDPLGYFVPTEFLSVPREMIAQHAGKEADTGLRGADLASEAQRLEETARTVELVRHPRALRLQVVAETPTIPDSDVLQTQQEEKHKSAAVLDSIIILSHSPRPPTSPPTPPSPATPQRNETQTPPSAIEDPHNKCKAEIAALTTAAATSIRSLETSTTEFNNTNAALRQACREECAKTLEECRQECRAITQECRAITQRQNNASFGERLYYTLWGRFPDQIQYRRTKWLTAGALCSAGLLYATTKYFRSRR